MATGRRQLLWCAVTSLFFGACLCGGEYPICAIPCCTVEPSCSRAQHITCDCPDMDTIALQKGDMSASVQVVHILNTKNVIMHNDAISSLQSLANFSLRGIGSVEIEQGGMNLQKRSKLRSVRIQDIETLRIRSKAFSGVWEQRTRVGLSGITRLNIESNAFDYASMSLGPSLMLQNVGILALASKGFNAPVADMSLDNVVMKVCNSESFGGHIQTTEFYNVVIAEAKARCVNGLGGLTKLSIQSSRMEVVRPQAFSGALHELIIKKSNFITMHERSLHLRVTNMEISKSFVKRLSSNGLSVRASGSIMLEKIQVVSLRKNALASLQIEPSQTGLHQPLIIRQLQIMEAESGSLTFPECADLQITDLDLVAPRPRICPTERWTRALSEGTESGPLTPAQYQLFFQLYDRGLCDEDDKLPLPIVAERPHCTPGPVSLRPHGDGDVSNEDSSKLRSGQEALVDYKVVGKDVLSRGRRSVDSDVRSDDDDASDEPAVPTHNSSVQPPPAVSKNPAPRKHRDTGGSVTTESAQTSSDHKHRLLLYLSLGVVISLAIVLAVGLLLLLLARRRRRRRAQKAANEPPPQPMETLLMVLANRLIQQENDGELGGHRTAPHRTISSSSGLGSSCQSVNSHQYESIREDNLINLDDGASSDDQTYNNLMDR